MTLSSSSKTVANRASFRMLSMVAFFIATMGLLSNLFHLHSLTAMSKNDPTDLMNHFIISRERDGEIMIRRQHQNRLKLQQQRRALELEPTNTSSSGSSSSSSSHDNAKELEEQIEDPPTLTLLRRLLRESIASLEACRRMGVTTHTTGRRLLEDTTTAQLRRRPFTPRFGWLNTLNNYLVANPAVHGGNNNQQQQQQEQSPQQNEECSVPSSQPACHVQAISMMVMSQGRDLRTLFVNLLSWILYTSVKDITVLLPNSVWMVLADDVKYGRRLLDWHEDSNHKVQLIPYNTSLWDGIRSVYLARSSSTTTTISSSIAALIHNNHNNKNSEPLSLSVVFLNGDIPWKGNDEGLQSGLALWKRHPASVIATNMLQFQIQPPPPMPLHPHHGTENNALPFCKHQKLVQRRPKTETIILSNNNHNVEGSDTSSSSVVNDEEKNDDPSLLISSILDLSGMMIHRDYLCLLSHPHVIKAITPFATDYREAQLTMSVLLTLASSGAPGTPATRLYPSRVQQDDNLNNNVTMSTTTALAANAFQSTTEEAETTTNSESDQPDELDQGDSNGDITDRRLDESNLVTTQKLKSKDEGVDDELEKMMQPLDDETVTKIVGYFGTLPPRPISWCSTQSGGGINKVMCSSSMSAKEDPMFHDLDWLRSGNPEQLICP